MIAGFTGIFDLSDLLEVCSLQNLPQEARIRSTKTMKNTRRYSSRARILHHPEMGPGDLLT